MKAFVLEAYGPGRLLQAAELPVPELRDDEALAYVEAGRVRGKVVVRVK